MTKKILLALSLMLCPAPDSFGQIYLNAVEVDESAIADTNRFSFTRIDIIGNDVTQPDVILRELHFNKFHPVTLEQLFAGLKRVQSLALFTRVKFDIIGESEHAILLITVFEQWYIFPIPLLYLNERSWDKITYGGKMLWYNFLGRNILLNFTAAFGYNPQFKLSYRNPWFLGDLQLFTNFSVYSGSVRSESLALRDYEDDRRGIEWLIGKRFGHFTLVGLTLAYAEISAPAAVGLTRSPDGTDDLPSIRLDALYDNRDLKEFPHQGWKALIWGKQVGNDDWINYVRYGADIRRYQPLGRSLTLAVRAAADMSSGEIPSYDRVFFGYSERIRGHFYDVVEGENLVFGGVELRFPIMKIRYFDVEPMPGFEQYSSNLKFGVSAGLFVDSGAVWYHDESLSSRHFNSGFGVGLFFHMPYIDVLRVECAFDANWTPQAIAEVVMAF